MKKSTSIWLILFPSALPVGKFAYFIKMTDIVEFDHRWLNAHSKDHACSMRIALVSSTGQRRIFATFGIEISHWTARRSCRRLGVQKALSNWNSDAEKTRVISLELWECEHPKDVRYCQWTWSETFPRLDKYSNSPLYRAKANNTSIDCLVKNSPFRVSRVITYVFVSLQLEQSNSICQISTNRKKALDVDTNDWPSTFVEPCRTCSVPWMKWMRSTPYFLLNKVFFVLKGAAKGELKATVPLTLPLYNRKW